MEAIAIVGLGCRFPGAANPAEYWRLLRDGIDAIAEVPAERWDVDAFYDPQAIAPRTMNTRWGGFLGGVERFDNQFFGISAREAQYMDPQQRLLLEVAYEALESAGQPLEQLAGSQTGVFVGICNSDYYRLNLNQPDDIDAYASTGGIYCIAANRLSYLLDLRGPSLAVDTACSSSLMAVHLACQSLRRGECALAVAAGVQLMLTPELSISLAKAHMLSPDGRCKTFDSRANGYVRGEGCGAVILKPLTRALGDGDPILAVIRGTAANQDGRSNGLTAPNGYAQQAVIREALADAGIPAGEIDYVEAHGTGTPLGDPIEALALGAVLAEGRPADRPCRVGSAKTNIGHLEAAAGIAGLIKVVLALRHRLLPPNLHFEAANPHIPFDRLPLRVQERLEPWPRREGPARAGVSSFGFGGTNAHVVLQEAPVGGFESLPTDDSPQLLPLSARSAEALRELADTLRGRLVSEPETDALAQWCYSAGVRRTHHSHRLCLVARSQAELAGHLETWLQGVTPPGGSQGRKLPSRSLKIAFVFTGQGPQWWAMGRQLWQREAVFRQVFGECDRLMGRYADWSLVQELLAEKTDSRLQETEIAQPVLFALQVALAALWRSWGVTPDAVVGHSVGEVAAAYVAGALHLPDALRLVFRRAQLMQRATGAGRMAAVWLGRAEVEPLIAAYAGLSVAALNSPTTTVLSGEADTLAAVLEQFEQRGVTTKMLPVNYAFHCPQMEPMRPELVGHLHDLKPRAGQIPFYSTVTGQIHPCNGLDAEYWGRNLREAVQFADAVDALIQSGHHIFVEIGPHPALASALAECLENRQKQGACLPSLRRYEDERATMLASLGQLYTLGCRVDWRLLYPQGPLPFVPLPAYPWQWRRFWLESTNGTQASNGHAAGGFATAGNGHRPAAPPQTSPPAEASPRNALLAASPAERLVHLGGYLREKLAAVLRQPMNAVDPQQPLTQLGLDSLMAVELRARVLEDFQINIPINLFFNNTGLGHLAEFLAEQTPAAEVPAAAVLPLLDPAVGMPWFRAWQQEFDPRRIERIDRQLVHKDYDHNVLLARLSRADENTVLAEMVQDLAHPFFYEHPKDHVPGLYLVEAARQLVTALSHVYHGVAMGKAFILDEIQARFLRLAETDAPVFLIARSRAPVYSRGELLQMHNDLCLLQNEAVVAEMSCLFRVFDPVGYDHLRSRKSQAVPG
ncbi:MAG: acyltransferase domain-containing protein [Aphanocapsa lilacina HA4352-LM1]|jgi:myxalamid-type polyketide synthase MxaE and MxaD|nr:acyltransferase domain-containing protein [Aphanocapsa lilacina HA4352-LM1]